MIVWLFRVKWYFIDFNFQFIWIWVGHLNVKRPLYWYWPTSFRRLKQKSISSERLTAITFCFRSLIICQIFLITFPERVFALILRWMRYFLYGPVLVPLRWSLLCSISLFKLMVRENVFLAAFLRWSLLCSISLFKLMVRESVFLAAFLRWSLLCSISLFKLMVRENVFLAAFLRWSLLCSISLFKLMVRENVHLAAFLRVKTGFHFWWKKHFKPFGRFIFPEILLFLLIYL